MKGYNHYHPITKEQKVIDFGTGEFIADKKRIPLLKALNECGLITRTHCYGHKSGHSFVSIIIDKNMRVEIRKIHERKEANRTKFNSETEVLISWKRRD